MRQRNGPTLWTRFSIKSARCGIALTTYAVMLTKKLTSKIKRAVMLAVLAGLVTAGCMTKTVTVKPDCDIPPVPPLPTIMSEDMASLPDSVYWALMDRERLLTDWALEMEARLEVLCKKNPD